MYARVFNNLDSLTLGQRLQRRLVEPAGVINTQQLHCHYQATQGTAGRLIQRSALPEQVKFRYGSGILQPTAIIQRLQRQRTESDDVFDGQFQSSPVPGETVRRFVQPQQGKFQNSGEIEGSREVGEQKSIVETHRQLRIDRQATVSEFNTLSSNESYSGQRRLDTFANTNPTVKTSGALSLSAPQKSSAVRISRKATIAAANASNSGSRSEGESKSPKSQDLPLAKATSQLSISTVQTNADASVRPKTNPPVIKGIIQTKAAETKSQSPVSTRSIVPAITHSKSLPLSLQRQQANLPVQLSPEASIASNPTVVSIKPTQLSSSSDLNMVWLKSTNGLQASERRSDSQKLPLPLAITQISTNGAIARQTNAVDNSTVQLAMPGNSTTLMSPIETASALPIDITKVAEQVSRILARQLAVERERRGIGRWY